ncbi:hypothetical protein GDO81_003423 [Engystomops pustulosus]|uniref:Coagulation factor IX n=1 Tax=Engystomops pustulosus TaxID=76066 RepID=A0AAV6ZVX0_ENGPU|nr:hypothetical protein GDO81_003423 [Engystomops pustulosus]
MASIPSLLIVFLLGYFCKAEKAVFLSDKSASSVLVRQKRYNAGRLEEFVAGNLERECIEEKCNYEEAREVFENDEKTPNEDLYQIIFSSPQMEFWKQYVDGDQCISNPCLHGGVCKDDVSAYVCWCQQGYRGKNCELELPITCTINNAVQYPCGKVTAPEALPKDVTRSIIDLEDFNFTSIIKPNTTENSTSKEGAGDIVPATVDPNVRIVGGTDSLKGEFPWQVHIVNKNGEGFCGGSIVNEKWIVTAGHCFLTADEFSVVTGEHNTEVKEGTEQKLKIKRIVPHPTYNATKSKYNNDIALVELAEPIKLNDYARPICVGHRDFTDKLLRTSSHSWVTGWGHVRYLGRPTITLQKLAVPYIDRANCKKSSRFFISKTMFCAGYSDQEKDSCQGDSGGPHSSEYRSIWFLTGITSWGDKCAEKDKYGVYTRVSQFTDWILSTTKLT